MFVSLVGNVQNRLIIQKIYSIVLKDIEDCVIMSSAVRLVCPCVHLKPSVV